MVQTWTDLRDGVHHHWRSSINLYTRSLLDATSQPRRLNLAHQDETRKFSRILPHTVVCPFVKLRHVDPLNGQCKDNSTVSPLSCILTIPRVEVVWRTVLTAAPAYITASASVNLLHRHGSFSLCLAS